MYFVTFAFSKATLYCWVHIHKHNSQKHWTKTLRKKKKSTHQLLNLIKDDSIIDKFEPSFRHKLMIKHNKSHKYHPHACRRRWSLHSHSTWLDCCIWYYQPSNSTSWRAERSGHFCYSVKLVPFLLKRSVWIILSSLSLHSSTNAMRHVYCQWSRSLIVRWFSWNGIALCLWYSDLFLYQIR